MKNLFRYWLPVIVVAVLILIGSSIPALPPSPFDIQHLDKAAHVLEFILFSFFLKRALMGGGPKHASSSSLKTVMWSIFYGIFNEVYQLFIPNREMSIFDLFFDGLGALGGVKAYFLWKGTRKNN